MQLNKTDALCSIQARLVHNVGLETALKPAQLQAATLETCLAAARAICMTAAELQQLVCPEDIQRPLNPRNEAAALALMLANKSSVCGNCQARQQQLEALLAAYPHSTQHSSSSSSGLASTQAVPDNTQQQEAVEQVRQASQPAPLAFPAESAEGLLYKWALQQGASSQVYPALFNSTTLSSSNTSGSISTSGSNRAGSSRSGSLQDIPAPSGLRGCAAAADLPAGAVVMAVPSKLLITYSTAAESDFGKALSRLPGLDPETLAVIWTMVDRHEPESTHAPFWAALPPHFGTGLSAPQPLVELLRGLPLYEECMQARAHVRQQFEALQQTFKILLTAYAAYLQPPWFREEAYLWAVDLWYAYAIQVKFPNGDIQPALVPLASLINHSAQPHVVHFSTINLTTHSLELRSFRPLQQHQQAFLSYGPLPNSQLLLFYGFALAGNPFDQQQLSVDPQEVAALTQKVVSLQQQQQQQGSSHGPSKNDLLAAKLQLLQELQLPLRFTVTVQQPLPPGLMPCLRLLCAGDPELQQVQQRLQQHRQQQQGSSSGGSGSSATAAAGPKRSPKATTTKAASSSHSRAAATSTTGSSSSSSGGREAAAGDAAVSLAAVQERWAAAAVHAAVLSSPLSPANEEAARAVLGHTLAAARQPSAACLTKLHKRRQLQALLAAQQQEQQQGQGHPPDEQGFMGTLETYLQAALDLFDACGDAAPGCSAAPAAE